MRSESAETANASLVRRRRLPALKRFQSTPGMKRNTGSRFAGLAQSCGAVHVEIPVARDDLSAVALAKADDAGLVPSGRTSPSRNVRPSNPPNCARKSVEQLRRTTDTSIPPAIASQHRQPI